MTGLVFYAEFQFIFGTVYGNAPVGRNVYSFHKMLPLKVFFQTVAQLPFNHLSTFIAITLQSCFTISPLFRDFFLSNIAETYCTARTIGTVLCEFLKNQLYQFQIIGSRISIPTSCTKLTFLHCIFFARDVHRGGDWRDRNRNSVSFFDLYFWIFFLFVLTTYRYWT